MSNTLQILHSFPPKDRSAISSDAEYDRLIRDYVKAVQRIPSSALTGSEEGTGDLFAVLNPAVHSIPYVLTLLVRIRALAPGDWAFKPGGSLWHKANIFVQLFDTVQVRYVGALLRDLLHAIEATARAQDALVEALPLIKDAMIRLDPSLSVFTSTHLNFLRSCMETRSYETAVSILDYDIHSFPLPEVEGIDPMLPSSAELPSSEYVTQQSELSDKIKAADVHEYFLLGAMAYIGVENYERAQLMLEHVLVAPTRGAATGLMLEAYRKWVLVSLLVTGKPPPLNGPQMANASAMRAMKIVSKAYDAVAEIFRSRDATRLAAEIEAGAGLWQQHGNKGLIDLVQQAVMRYWVSDLEATYAAIPIGQVASWLSQPAEEVEAYVQSLIESGHLAAIIDRTSPFSSSPSSTDPSSSASKLPPSSAKNTTAKAKAPSTDSQSPPSAVLRFYRNSNKKININNNNNNKNSSANATNNTQHHPDAHTDASEHHRHAALVAQTERINALVEQIRQAEARVTLTHEYVEYRRRRRMQRVGAGGERDDGLGESGGAGGGGVRMGGEGGDSFDRDGVMVDDEDEDMMSDLR